MKLRRIAILSISVYFLGFPIYYVIMLFNAIACSSNFGSHGWGRVLNFLYYPFIMLLEKLLTK